MELIYAASSSDDLGQKPIRTVRRQINQRLQTVTHPDCLEAFLLICQELLSNAADHGEGESVGWRVRVAIDQEWLEATVTDSGIWQDTPSAPGRGNGIRLVLSFSDELCIRKTTSGTIVTVRKQLHQEELHE